MLKSKSILLFLLVWLPLLAWGQGIPDAGEMSLSIPKGEAGRSQIYQELENARNLSNSAPQDALALIEKALEASFSIKDKEAEGWCYHTLGYVNYQIGKYSMAADNFEKALGLFREVGNEAGLNKGYQNIALAYENGNQLGKALEYFLLVAKRAERQSNRLAFIQAQKDIARNYFKLGELPLALNRYQTLLDIYRTDNNEEGIGEAYNNIGSVYLEMSDTNKAIEYYKLSTNTASIAADTTTMVIGYNNLTNVYQQQNSNYEEQISYQSKVLDMNTKRRDVKGQNRANWTLANTFLDNNNTIEAIPFLESAISITRQSGLLKEEGEAVEALSQVYEDLGDYKKALESYKEYVLIVDSLQDLRDEEVAASLKLNDEITRREERIDLLERSQLLTVKEMEILKKETVLQEEGLARQRWINWLLVGLLVVSAGAGLMIWRSSRAKRRANQLLALKSLRSQMNPHFIFNSLNSVNSFIARNDERSANKFLSEFSRLMRAVLENSQHEFIPLSREIEILGLYLNLEHFRFKDKFNYTFEVSPELQQESFSVPPMLIQPYIENAIWHGLRYKEEMGLLKVEIRAEGEDMVCIVEDNGIGRERSLLLKTQHQKEHQSTGLKNTSERLQIINKLYKTHLRVQIDDLYAGDRPSGTRVSLRIPLQHARINEEGLT